MNPVPVSTTGLRVLVLFPDAPDAVGGIARYARSLLLALGTHPAVARVELLARRGNGGALPGGGPGGGPGAVRGFPSRCGFAMNVLASAARGVDIVVCGHIHYATLARAAAALAGASLWSVFHGIEAWPRPGALRRRALEDSDQLIAVSRYTRSRVLEWARVEAWRCRVLHPAVDVSDAADATSRTSRADGANRGPVLLSVSRLDASEAYKGHDTVIRALPGLSRRLPGVRYQVAGDGDDRTRLQTLCREEGVEGMVSFLGQVSNVQRRRLYAEADIFVMPSDGEGFGIVFIEALAAGLPVVAADAAGARDALRDGALGELVPPRDPLALAAAVEKTWRAPRGAADLSCFSESAHARRLGGMVDDFLQRRGKA